MTIEAMIPFLTKFRHEMHRFPELSNQEIETTKKIKAVLAEYEIEVVDTNLKTGLIARITGANPGKTIALRADIDALPIVEQSGVPYTSEYPGVMHACGHDMHTSVLLGAAIVLKQQAAQLNGEILLVFQAAEETGVGAKTVLTSGALAKVEAIFGFHNDPSLPVGTLGTKAGALTAAVDRFEIQIKAKGAHAAKPHEGRDPMLVIAQIIQAFQPLISREIAPDSHAVVSITQVHSGSTWNVIPDTGMLEGTVRTFSRENRVYLEQRIRKILTQLALLNEVEIELLWYGNCPSVLNDPLLTDLSLACSRNVMTETKVVKETAIGEDFAYYQETIPGSFVMIGSGGPYELHDPRFRVDDAMLPQAIDYFVALATAYLNESN
ncbi:amidohydrolase [uncultured Enterococcus sp.]|uniref:amidohydrolase n=1 Tax=uncultured Enterococcus sp. TaxID=167972 RepID=UPI0025DA6420|nr:amidohydrolase [uncultured Enterococcus sp.]